MELGSLCKLLLFLVQEFKTYSEGNTRTILIPFEMNIPEQGSLAAIRGHEMEKVARKMAVSSAMVGKQQVRL